MALISQSIKNLKGGISQQPDILRYPEQGSEQINGWSSETEGLQKRPPLLFVKTLGDQNVMGPSPLLHLINRDAQERYYVSFTGNGIKVHSLEGTSYTVTGNMNYVTTSNPRNDLRMVTVADYTFIVNRNYEVKSSGVINYTLNERRSALLNVRGGQYGRTFTINMNGSEVSLTIANGTDPSHVNQTDSQWIVNRLIELMTANTAWAGWSFNAGKGFIYVVAPVDITVISTTDGYGNQLLNAVMHTAQSFAKLPIEAPNGYTVRIVGDTSKTADQFYVQYDDTKKVWKEVAGWGIETGFMSSSMPHALVRQADGTFKLQELPWSTRQCGDDDTNPLPSLVGQKINDVFFFRNRLGFLAGENIVMSRTSKYFNLFPASVANLSDDDPIDVAVSHNRISILKYAVPFSEELLLWSDQAQFVLSAAGVMSSKTVELNLTTEFDVSDAARPYGIGRGVYFASPRASYTSLNRYYAIQDTSAVKSAEDMSAHVPSYVPNGVFSIRGSGTENFVSTLSSNAKSKIFIYKYLYMEEQIVQQSWGHWEFGSNVEILACDSIGSSMFIVMRNQSHTWMSRVDFTKNSVDFNDEPYRLFMDNKMKIPITAGSYNDDTYQTVVRPYDHYGCRIYHGKMYIVAHDGQVHEFEEPDGGWPNGEPVLYLSGNWENQTVFIGLSINFRYVFSKFLIKKTAEDGSSSTEDIGRLQLRRSWVNYEQSGAFTVEVTNTSRLFSYAMAGARLGSAALRVGALNVGTGQFRFPVTGNAQLNTVSIISDYTTPLNVIGCGWEGNYLRRSSGI
ncbi:tail protein [Yersinia phage fPS-53]|uniref:Tail tubular protein B n=3 Tax=Helsettvirus fPS53 TaxID=2733626 RepID=A0A2H1UJ93_9CAUD|nr:tail protein [Yersinia phage fPS-53]SOO46620.1 tail tubular protein B [Yersinia phage fPS-89]SOO56452.1 tail tubular protein B [Yersinia phage fPS-85]SOO56503.1 tail tubular protein B [Yersinia phage fPS-53]